MNLLLDDLTINISYVNSTEITEDWKWLLKDITVVLMISKLGDMFLEGPDGSVYWLATDTGELTNIAQNVNVFKQLLNNDGCVDNWFLPSFIEELMKAGITLDKHEVYSYKKMPLIGGEYCIENIEPTNISVHFSITGQIYEQIKDLPDGTSIKLKLKE